MKATSLLKRQHRKVEKLFAQLESSKGNPATLLIELANDLAAHMAIEEEILYPRIRSIDENLFFESNEEHSIAQFALKRLWRTDPDDEAFKARVTTLKELIEHHVQEEENETFPMLEKTIEEDMLQELGKAMEQRFEEILEQMNKAILSGRTGRTTTRNERDGNRARP